MKLKNNKGIAIIMVIATILFLTSLIMDYFADSLRNHQITLNYKARLQSYYLAKSAINFSKLLLYYNKELESTLEKEGIDTSQFGAEPLYKMVPISSEMMRGLLSSGGSETGDEEVAPEEEDQPAELDMEASLLDDSESIATEEGISMLKKDEAESFLDFTGDFESEISEESSKLSLNAITKMLSSAPEYDLFKKILMSILQQEKYQNLFVSQKQDSEDLVNAIFDFTDSNDAINEFDNVERGREDSIYKNIDYPVKDTAYLTLSEIRLVAGMTDDIFAQIEPWVTVYHTDNKINICLAEEELVNALILYYTNNSECATPIKEGDTETLDKLREVTLAYCPDKSDMASALNVELGLKDEADTEEDASTAESKATTSMVTGCLFQFENLLSEDNDVFRIVAAGTVGEIRTQITEVIDASASKTSSWKVLYYQVD